MDINGIEPVGGPVWVAWRAGTLTRAKELEALAAWVRSQNPRDQVLEGAIQAHLDAPRQAATTRRPTLRTGPMTAARPATGAPVLDIDNVVAGTAKPGDLLIVEMVGLAAAAIAGAAAIRRSADPPSGTALAMLKLPTGAITAFLGLLLMRGPFVPGLSALDTSAQILAWALVFGYGQQLFTRLVDQQGQTVLNSIRAPDKPAT
jgi:hypothetical protein